jgi:hypothetical protein
VAAGQSRRLSRDLTQWSLLGVVTTELSVNAHAYLVTLFAGPNAFALIAAGALFMRPVSLCLTALPDRERPVMVEKLAAGDHAGAQACVRDFLGAVGAVWLLTVALAAAAMIWFPRLILKAAYGRQQIVTVVARPDIGAADGVRPGRVARRHPHRRHRDDAAHLRAGPPPETDAARQARIHRENLFALKAARRKTDSIPATNPKSPRPPRLRVNPERDRAMRKLFSNRP